MTNKKTRYKLRYYWSICSLKAHFFSGRKFFSLEENELGCSWSAKQFGNKEREDKKFNPGRGRQV